MVVVVLVVFVVVEAWRLYCECVGKEGGLAVDDDALGWWGKGQTRRRRPSQLVSGQAHVCGGWYTSIFYPYSKEGRVSRFKAIFRCNATARELKQRRTTNNTRTRNRAKQSLFCQCAFISFFTKLSYDFYFLSMRCARRGAHISHLYFKG